MEGRLFKDEKDLVMFIGRTEATGQRLKMRLLKEVREGGFKGTSRMWLF